VVGRCQLAGQSFGRSLSALFMKYMNTAQAVTGQNMNRERFPYVGWGYEKDVQRVNRGDRAWLKQVWFAGNHSDIGGSYPEDESRLSDIALGWMLEELKALDNPPHANESMLRLFPDAGAMQHDEVKSSHDSRLPTVMAWKAKDRPIKPQADLHPSVIERFERPAVAQYDELKPYRPAGLLQHEKVLRFYGD
jgi:hypothetical protein